MAAAPRRALRTVRRIIGFFWWTNWITLGVMLVIVLPFRMLGHDLGIPWYMVDVLFQPDSTNYSVTQAQTEVSIVNRTGWLLAEDYGFIEHAAGKLAIYPPNGWWAACFNVVAIALSALTLWVLYLLRKLFGALENTSPFTRENARRLWTIGQWVFWGTLVDSLIDCLLHLNLSRHVVTHGIAIKTSWTPQWGYVVLGLFAIALSELFQHGVDLEEERELTV